MAVAQARTERIRTADLIAGRRRDRFVQPAASDPRRVSAVEARLWQLLPDEFRGVELSPVAPLGSCVALAPVSQNRILTTMRLTEVVSDSTNVLAIEAAARRADLSAETPVHVAAAHRVLRAQAFEPGLSAHFRLFALVSSARDTGSARTEVDLLTRHVTFWVDVLEGLAAQRRPRIELTVFDDPLLESGLVDNVVRACETDTVQVVRERDRERGRHYYTGLAIRLSVDAGHVELGDGGFTTWTAQLTQNRKERCLVSCIATERLTDIANSTDCGD
jgi:hypothetical protein